MKPLRALAGMRGLERLRVRDRLEIVATIARKYGFTAEQIVHGGRQADLVRARREVICVLDEMGHAAIEIGRLLDLNHATVLHHLRVAASGEPSSRRSVDNVCASSGQRCLVIIRETESHVGISQSFWTGEFCHDRRAS